MVAHCSSDAAEHLIRASAKLGEMSAIVMAALLEAIGNGEGGVLKIGQKVMTRFNFQDLRISKLEVEVEVIEDEFFAEN